MQKTPFDKTPEELSQELNSKSNNEIQKQTVVLGKFLEIVAHAVTENKNVSVENIGREILNKLQIERPDWLEELKLDTTPIQKKLDYIASAIIRKEVVKKMDLNRPVWLDEIIPKDITFPEQKEAEKLIPVIQELIRAVENQDKPKEEVSIKGLVEIKEPKWWKPADISSPLVSFGAFLKKLSEQTIFKISGKIEVSNPVTEVTIKNPTEKVEVKNFKKLIDNTDLMTAQLRALGTTGGTGGGGTNAETDGKSQKTPTSKQVATKITAPDANTTYVAIAPIGSTQASAVWQVQKIITSGNDTTITWAGGGAFNQVATDLTSLIFT